MDQTAGAEFNAKVRAAAECILANDAPPQKPGGSGAETMSEQASRLETYYFQPNGLVPNSCFPVLIHRAAVTAGVGGDLADAIEATFRPGG